MEKRLKYGWPFLIVCVYCCLGAATILQVYQGGTGATTASGARTNLGALSTLPPYFTDGTNLYDADGFQITKPPSSLTWLSNTPSSVTLGTNGDQVIVTGGNCSSSGANNLCFQSVTITTSVDIEFTWMGANTALGIAGVWAWDGGSTIYQLYAMGAKIVTATCTYSGSGNPASCETASVTQVGGNATQGRYHLRWIVISSNLTAQIYLDGQTPITLLNAGAVTPSKGGFFFGDGGTVLLQGYIALIHEKAI